MAVAAFAALAAFASLPRAAVADDGSEPARPARDWDLAIGVNASLSPAYGGADDEAASLQPGLALRWKRLSLASRSAFAVYRGDEGAARGGGLRLEVLEGRRWRASLGLRAGSGRRESASPALAGLGDVRSTVFARATLGLRLDARNRLTTTVLVDALGRDSGTQWITSLVHDRPLTPATTLSLSASLSAADRRHHRTWYGVSPAQSLASGYAVYEPRAGLAGAALSAGLRTRLSPHWVLFGGAGASRLAGPAARSPFVRQRTGWGANLGVVYAF